MVGDGWSLHPPAGGAGQICMSLGNPELGRQSDKFPSRMAYLQGRTVTFQGVYLLGFSVTEERQGENNFIFRYLKCLVIGGHSNMFNMLQSAEWQHGTWGCWLVVCWFGSFGLVGHT